MSMWKRLWRVIISQGFTNTSLSVMVGLFAVLLTYLLSQSWDWISDDESGSTTMRNLGLVVAAVVAFPLALWRSAVAQHQAETAERGLLNERYQKGAEMLGSQVLAVRIGGIYALLRLAAEHPKEYNVQIILLLCAFVRHPTKDEEIEALRVKTDDLPEMRPDVEEAMVAINIERRVTSINLRDADLRQLRLFGANLSRAILWQANLSGAELGRSNLNTADLSGANLHCADMSSADLRRATLHNADLSNAKLYRANLSGVWLKDANLSGTDFCGPEPDHYPEPATGLTQGQLDEACADSDNPPNLDGVLDAETGESLVWRNRPNDRK